MHIGWKYTELCLPRPIATRCAANQSEVGKKPEESCQEFWCGEGDDDAVDEGHAGTEYGRGQNPRA